VSARMLSADIVAYCFVQTAAVLSACACVMVQLYALSPLRISTRIMVNKATRIRGPGLCSIGSGVDTPRNS
jgi:hypothetical protein